MVNPRVYLSRLPAPDGARAYALTLAPRVRWDGSEVKPTAPARSWGILGRFARLLVRLVARKG